MISLVIELSGKLPALIAGLSETTHVAEWSKSIDFNESLPLDVSHLGHLPYDLRC